MTLVEVIERADVEFEVSPTLAAWHRRVFWDDLLRDVDYDEPYEVRREKHPLLHDWPSSFYPPDRCPHCNGVLA